QAKAEWEERLGAGVLEASVTDEYAFAIDDPVRVHRIVVVVVGKSRIVRNGALPGDRKAAGRVGVSSQQVCQSRAALLPRIPALDHRLDGADPGLDVDRATGVDHHHGVGIGGGNGLDQLDLSGWQGEFAIT